MNPASGDELERPQTPPVMPPDGSAVLEGHETDAIGSGALDPEESDRFRQHVILLASVLGAVMAPFFALLESTKPNMDAVEQYALPGLALVFAALALLARRGFTELAGWGLVTAGAAILLERLHHVLYEPNPGLQRVVNGYELISWFPSLYIFCFVLFEKKRALLFSLALLLLSALIVRDGVTAGVLGGMYAVDPHEFYASQLVCLFFVYLLSGLKERFVATQRVALALRNFAETDFLTGIANRRSLTQAFEREIARCERLGFSLAVILLDIDRFKLVNDTLGHAEGDRVLRRVSQLMDRSRRRSDLFGRWGGEEFLLVAPDLDLEGARVAAERMRGIIESGSGDSRLDVTASFGVSEFVSGDDVASLVKRADEALMRAKATGRNRVETHAA